MAGLSCRSLLGSIQVDFSLRAPHRVPAVQALV